MNCLRWILATLLVLGTLWTSTSESQAASADLAIQKEKQKQIQMEANRLIRRIETRIRVLQYNRLDGTARKAVLEEVCGTLRGLTRQQMAALIAALDQAAITEGETRSAALGKAQQQRAEIILGLKSILARFDAVRSLDQAAERLEKMAEEQVDLFRRNVEILFEAEHIDQPKKDSTLKLRVTQLYNEQGFLNRDFTDLVKQLGQLHSSLPAVQQTRLAQFTKRVESGTIRQTLEEAQDAFKSTHPNKRNRGFWEDAAEQQWWLAGEFLARARELRPTPDRLMTIREARYQLEGVIETQKRLRDEVIQPPKREGGDVVVDDPNKLIKEMNAGQRRPLSGKALARFRKKIESLLAYRKQVTDPAYLWGKEVANRQILIEHQTRNTRGVMSVHLSELARKLTPAEEAMREAQSEARAMKEAKVVTPLQDRALATLLKVKEELDRLLAEEEKALYAPTNNLHEALARIERMIQEQTELRDQTKQVERIKHLARLYRRNVGRLAETARKQAALAREAEAVQQQLNQPDSKTREGLTKASTEMRRATESLKARADTKKTQTQQEEALKGLEQAHKALLEKLKAIEARRDEIAKLEEADRKLAKLIKAEKAIAKKAKENPTKPTSKDKGELAREQAKLTPATTELGKELKSSAPEAAKKVDDGASSMEAAQAKLDKKQPKPAAKDADKAVAKLEQARKDLKKILDKKTAAEAAQAKKPENVDAANAAQQLAKALEQTRKAETEAKKANAEAAKQAKTDPMKGTPDLAGLQKEVAKQAAKVNAPEAKKPADDAAEALKKGDLAKALKAQAKALAKLQAAAKSKTDPAKGKKGETPKKGDEGEKGKKPEKGDKGKKDDKGKGDKGKKSEKGDEGKKDGKGEAGKKDGKGDEGKKGSDSSAPAQAKNAGELAKVQKALMEATRALAKSKEATRAAMAALGQAQAQAPKAAKPQLGEAGKQLAKAAQALQKGEAKSASKAQGEAANQLAQAMQALKNAQAQAQAQGQGQKPGQGTNPMPGMGDPMGPSTQPGMGTEQNETSGNGDRIADGQGKIENARGGSTSGKGLFTNLPPRQRELIRQAMMEKLPPEYAALIQRYYQNIASGKPAPTKSKR